MKYFSINRLWSYLFSAIMGFLEPLSVLFLWLLIFILVDMVSGCYASLKEGKHLESRKMQKTIIKFILYTTSVILLHGLDLYMITFAECGLARIGSSIICGIEIYSIFENFYRATKNPVFRVLTQFTLQKVEGKTGVKINKKKH